MSHAAYKCCLLSKNEAGIAVCFCVDVRVCSTSNWLAFLYRRGLGSLEYSTSVRNSSRLYAIK